MTSAEQPVAAVGAVVVDDDRLLLVRRGHGPAAGTWALPGGRVEVGETLAEAVVRELREETSIEGVCGPLVGVVELLPTEGLVAEGPSGSGFHDEEPGKTPGHFLILGYAVSILESTEPVAGDDAAEARWVDLGDVAELRLAPGLAEFLHDHGIIETIT